MFIALALQTFQLVTAMLSCLARMSPPKHDCYLSYKMRTFQLFFLAVFHNCRHLSSHKLAVEKLSFTKILHTLRMRPVAITLNYSVKNTWNDVCQIIIIIYMWQSRVEIEHYSVAYCELITAFEAL